MSSSLAVCHTCFSSQSIFCHFERDLRLHKLVFEDDILPDGTEVGYFVAGKVRSAWQMAFLQLVNVTLSTPTISFIMQKMLVGYKKGFGIHCSCCNKVVSSLYCCQMFFPGMKCSESAFIFFYETRSVLQRLRPMLAVQVAGSRKFLVAIAISIL